jgi:inosose dehydratase
MIIGCFALIEPFTPLARQFELIRSLGIQHADLTDNHDGAGLGAEYGFHAAVSLDQRPGTIRELAKKNGLSLASVCAHANLLDATDPAVYGTSQIIKAIRLAHLLGIKQVITTEGDPKTDFGHRLTEAEQIFSIREKLQAPIAWARDLGVELLLEPHGRLTDTVERMSRILDALGAPDVVAINLDTGNLWLGGGDPLQFVKTFGPLIKHVHWKDMSEEWVSRRGKQFGCGMGTIPLGDGVVGIRAIVEALKSIGFSGPTTLEVAGTGNVKLSIERLNQWA